MKEKNIPYNISWEIVSKSKSYTPASQSCNLCIREIFFILFKSEMATLNSRCELMGSCRHRDKFKLNKTKTSFQ